MLAFVLASAIGGLAGFLIAATDHQITPMFGMWATTKGLIAMMLGGLGSVPGAILGGSPLASSRPICRDCSDRRGSEEHTSDLPSLMRTSYAGFRLKKKN